MANLRGKKVKRKPNDNIFPCTLHTFILSLSLSLSGTFIQSAKDIHIFSLFITTYPRGIKKERELHKNQRLINKSALC